MTDVVIVNSGVANLASVASAFRRLGADIAITADAEEVRRAARVVLPGVGAFGSGMAALERHGLDAALHDVARDGAPLLAICLGLQLLCDASEESPGIPGLGLIPGVCRRLPHGVRVPHLGWNGVEPDGRSRCVAAGEASFANSFCLTDAPTGWAAGWTTHGVRFVSVLEREALLACQFHPELSGPWGLALLERWLTGKAAKRGEPLPLRPPGLARRLVPCLDVKDGRVVKGIRFQELRDAGDPAERAAAYEAQGADEIVVLDIAASPSARETQADTVRRVRAALSIPLTVGGGVRSVEDARRLLAAGADRVSVNTAAVERAQLLAELCGTFGSQCVVLAIDARRIHGTTEPRWEVLVMGGRDATGLDVVEWARRGVGLGAGEILLTSWDRDGTRTGCDLDLIEAVSAAVEVPVIASGGIGTRHDVARAFAAGADAVLAASVLHDDEESVAGIKADLAAQGVPVRR